MNLSDPTMQMFLPLIMMGAIFYFLVWRPQSQRTRQLRTMISNLRRGDTVVTAAGILGKVVKASEANDPEILVEIADNVQVRVVKATLTDVRPKGGDAAAADKA
jgi:preprotein translocase subunit YajC